MLFQNPLCERNVTEITLGLNSDKGERTRMMQKVCPLPTQENQVKS